MGKQDIELFMNDNFKVLRLMQNNITVINKAHICPMTQQEIAESLGFSLMKVNAIMITLRDGKYIDRYKNSRGRYVITTKGKKVLSIIDNNIDLEENNNGSN